MKVKYQHPGLQDGTRISITGLNAILLNNEEVEVSDEAIAHYEAVTGKKFSETLQSPVFTGNRKQPEPQPEPEHEIVSDQHDDGAGV